MSFVDCDADLPSHIEANCNQFKHGGFSAVALLKIGQTTITDFTNPTQWATAEANGDALIIRSIKAQMPEPSAVTVDNPVACGAEQIIDGYNATFGWIDANVNSANDNLYNLLHKTRRSLVIYNCSEGEIRHINETVTFQAIPMYPAGKTEFQTYSVTASWTTKPETIIPTLYTAPAGIFDLAA